MVPPVSISYSALPSTSDYDSIKNDLYRQLPLRNLHWIRNNSQQQSSQQQRSIRTINDLHVEFKPLKEFQQQTNEGGGTSLNLLERPYLQILFVVCDDTEVYRSTIRSQIREWLDSITLIKASSSSSSSSSSRNNNHQHEWLIVHVTSGKSGGAKFYQRKSGIIDKIKTDFNVGKKDRCIQVFQGASTDDPTAWAEFSNKVKEGIVTTFDQNVALYEENVRKADSQRQLEGWNFLPFFLQKECLADSFEAMTLYEEALIQYDELEASFFQNLKEHRISWINNIGGLSPNDDSLPLLSTSTKPYRQSIESGTISVFDFRTYLFVRQVEMLFKLARTQGRRGSERTVEVAKRGAMFVSTFARTLREHQNILGSNFVESWTYSACLNIVETCERYLVTDQPVGQFLAVKAELLELAKKQVDKIGMGAGHLPMIHPFSMSLNETSPTNRSTSPPPPPNTSTTSTRRSPVTRQDLLDAIKSREVFDQLYIELNQKTIQAYQSSGRKRCAIKLHAGLAALETHRSRPVAAQKLFSQLPAHYVDLRWTHLESYLLSQCTSLQRQLDMPKERLLSTLALVRSGVEYKGERWSLRGLKEEEMDAGVEGDGEEGTKDRELAKGLMKDVYDLSSALTKDFAAVAFPTFSIRLSPGTGERAADEDGTLATAIVRNLLPTDLSVDEVRLKFSTDDGEQIWFTAGKTELQASKETSVCLFCPTAATGRLSLELSQLRFSRIIFQYSHRPISSRNLAPDPRLAPVSSDGKQPYIVLGQDYQAVNVEIEAADTIHLDRERQIIVCVDPGRNSLTKITLQFEMQRSSMRIDTKRARIVGKDSAGRLGTSLNADQVVLEGLKPYEVVKIELPLSGEILDPIVSFAVLGDYVTVKRPTLRRTLRRTFSHSIGLPLAVNVQDYFREDCLLSKFSITTDGLQGLKVRNAVLEPPKGVEVKACRAADAPPVTISSVQTANFLFKVFCARPTEITGPLRLVLRYSSIEDQLLSRLRSTVTANIDDSLRTHTRWLSSTVVQRASSAVDLRRYAHDQDLHDVTFDARFWRREIERYSSSPEERKVLVDTVEGIYRTLPSTSPDLPETQWRRLEIPLELPSLSILNLVSVVPALSRVEVGQSIPVTVSLRSLFKWRRETSSSDETLRLRYEIVANPVEWVVSGRTRGEFEVSEINSEQTLSLTLIPLQPSALFLPSVSIMPVELPSNPTRVTCETQHIAAAATVEVLPVLMKSSWEARTLNGGGQFPMMAS